MTPAQDKIVNRMLIANRKNEDLFTKQVRAFEERLKKRKRRIAIWYAREMTKNGIRIPEP